jgi:hypothetical protein
MNYSPTPRTTALDAQAVANPTTDMADDYRTLARTLERELAASYAQAERIGRALYDEQRKREAAAALAKGVQS